MYVERSWIVVTVNVAVLCACRVASVDWTPCTTLTVFASVVFETVSTSDGLPLSPRSLSPARRRAGRSRGRRADHGRRQRRRLPWCGLAAGGPSGGCPRRLPPRAGMLDADDECPRSRRPTRTGAARKPGRHVARRAASRAAASGCSPGARPGSGRATRSGLPRASRDRARRGRRCWTPPVMSTSLTPSTPWSAGRIVDLPRTR